MIFQIQPDNKVNRVYLAGDITELEYLDKYNTNNDLISYPTELVPNVAFLKYENEQIVEDLEAIVNFEKEVYVREAISILPRTDYLMLIDNPADLTDEQITIVKKYRKDLREVNITGILPACPDFLLAILNK